MRQIPVRLFALVMAGAVLAPGGASAHGRSSPSAPSGTWTFIDHSPDPTSTPEPADRHCHGQLPSLPGDVNAQSIKVKSTARLELTAHNLLDWAVEVRSATGDVVAGTDGGDLTTPESLEVILGKGRYEVVYCNLEGEPEITVDYRLSKV